MHKWWTYQKERFPLFKNGLLVLAFSGSAITYSALATDTKIMWWSCLVAFISCLLFFLQLRIADEFKDAEEDAQYRPYRPVPRGLIKLSELRLVFILCALIQLGLALTVSPYLLITLGISWIYLALMSKEFFVREWITARPITYLWTHMLIMPLIDLYATSCQWLPAGEKPWLGLTFFLVASFGNGLVIEIGRKLRLPKNEERGVPTYSKLWGLQKALWVWIFCLFLTMVFGCLASSLINALPLTLGTLMTLFVIALVLCLNPKFHADKRFETFSGIWTLGLYLNLGIIPAIVRLTSL